MQPTRKAAIKFALIYNTMDDSNTSHPIKGQLLRGN